MRKEFSIKINRIPYWAFVSMFCVLMIPVALVSGKKIMPKLQGGVLRVRKIKFLLYTDKNFSSNSDCVSLVADIENSNNNVIRKPLASSAKLSGTPHYALKLMIEKIAPDKDAYLKLGFPQYTAAKEGNPSSSVITIYQIVTNTDCSIQLCKLGCYSGNKE